MEQSELLLWIVLVYVGAVDAFCCCVTSGGRTGYDRSVRYVMDGSEGSKHFMFVMCTMTTKI